eukprot:7347752-Pyramimonas_sp.AAC.1
MPPAAYACRGPSIAAQNMRPRVNPTLPQAGHVMCTQLPDTYSAFGSAVVVRRVGQLEVPLPRLLWKNEYSRFAPC